MLLDLLLHLFKALNVKLQQRRVNSIVSNNKQPDLSLHLLKIVDAKLQERIINTKILFKEQLDLSLQLNYRIKLELNLIL